MLVDLPVASMVTVTTSFDGSIFTTALPTMQSTMTTTWDVATPISTSTAKAAISSGAGVGIGIAAATGFFVLLLALAYFRFRRGGEAKVASGPPAYGPGSQGPRVEDGKVFESPVVELGTQVGMNCSRLGPKCMS